MNRLMQCRQQHAVIQFIDDLLCRIAQGDEIEYISIFIQRAGNFHRNTPVMAVQPLTDVSVEGDEVGRTENKVVFRYMNAVGCFIGHSRFFLDHQDTPVGPHQLGKQARLRFRRFPVLGFVPVANQV